MSTQAKHATEQPEQRATGKTARITVVDLGKARRKKEVRRLRKGEGKLMTRVHELVNELLESGTIQGTAHPVVVVVRQRQKRSFTFGRFR